jgi:hypothetical protein
MSKLPKYRIIVPHLLSYKNDESTLKWMLSPSIETSDRVTSEELAIDETQAGRQIDFSDDDEKAKSQTC